MRNKIINIVILLVFLGVEIYNFKENYNGISFDSLRSSFWLIHIGVSTLYIAVVTYFLKTDLGYYDLFLFFLPLIGGCILLCEFLFSLFKERIVNNIEKAKSPYFRRENPIGFKLEEYKPFIENYYNVLSHIFGKDFCDNVLKALKLEIKFAEEEQYTKKR